MTPSEAIDKLQTRLAERGDLYELSVNTQALRIVLSALASNANAAAGWRPIESAPKDGSDILVYRPKAEQNDHIPLVGIDYWSKKLGNVWALSNYIKQPTHWQSLPSPPKE